MKLSDIRREYVDTPLRADGLPAEPYSLFRGWLDLAEKADVDLPNAMVLATSDSNGQPTTRMVLLKGFEDEALFFYTDYGSIKARDIDENPRVSLNFFWAPLDRQVSIVGVAERCSREQSEAYFGSRPRASQISAVASSQSQPIADRATLEEEFQAIEAQYEGEDIPCKAEWGGYSVRPSEFIFWQGRPSRLHDRFRYALQDDGSWRLQRLSP